MRGGDVGRGREVRRGKMANLKDRKKECRKKEEGVERERPNGIAKDEEREKRNDKEVWQRRVGKMKRRKRVFMPTGEKARYGFTKLISIRIEDERT